ncbi:MAG: hypothetical protein GY765_16825 [bacterium]|nr:hypothetical protein [bacterium]
MKKMFMMPMVLIVFLHVGLFLHGAISAGERAALIAIYNSNDGANWSDNSNWKGNNNEADGFSQIGTEDTWFGITVTGDHVTAIDMRFNGLRGELPSQLGNLAGLNSLFLRSNYLSGLPTEIGNLKYLYDLTLTHNDLTAIPPELGNCTNLYELYLDYNELTSLPAELENCSNLYTLEVSYNQLTGLPAELGNCSNLYNLGAAYNQLTDIPPELGSLSNLYYLNLDSNKLNGSIPAELGNLAKLNYLYLGYNQLSAGIPPELGNCSSLVSLRLTYNQLSGSIPPELGNLSNLSSLNLSINQLSGSIPPELGNCSSLNELRLYTNRLSGSIPPELGNFSTLYRLHLSNNQLSGSLPPELGNLSSLVSLYLQNNRLSGTIPSEFGNPVNLYTLDLASNQLSGSIPVSMTSTYQAHFLNINYNSIYPDNEYIRNFLDTATWGWEATQTIAPANISALASSLTSVHLSWTPIMYTADTGGYKVYYSTTPGGPRTYAGITADKSVSSYQLTGLTPGETYYIVVQTQTDSHSNNGNLVVSHYSDEAVVTMVAPQLRVNRSVLKFGCIAGSGAGSQEFLVFGHGYINWTAAASVSWLNISPSTGTLSGLVTVTPDTSGMAAGTYTGSITVTDPNAVNSVTVTVQLQVYESGSTGLPFGEFASPGGNDVVSSSIAVTGWALDDVGVESVKIYREEGNDLVYIGDADFVDGARPDLEQAFPDTPMNYRAGWGYMLLTNMLPNGGNGTFTLLAKAADSEGNTVSLGTKTITVDNANAIKPFGAIDTPTQGGEASGSAYNNQGWVLTPMPNTVPFDGSTINVYVDGVSQGHPEYNLYRPDVAEYFPGYANSDGALARIELDLSHLETGMHQIFWTAVDDAGNSDGIGSRYFTVNNSGESRTSQAGRASQRTARQTAGIPLENFGSVKMIKGFGSRAGDVVTADAAGMIRLELEELQRVELHLAGPVKNTAHKHTAQRSGKPFAHTFASDRSPAETPSGVSRYNGYLQVGEQLRPLPIGSTLDQTKGIFYWQPGPGFVGTYELVFIVERASGESTRKNIVIDIRAGN